MENKNDILNYKKELINKLKDIAPNYTNFPDLLIAIRNEGYDSWYKYIDKTHKVEKVSLNNPIIRSICFSNKINIKKEQVDYVNWCKDKQFDDVHIFFLYVSNLYNKIKSFKEKCRAKYYIAKTLLSMTNLKEESDEN